MSVDRGQGLLVESGISGLGVVPPREGERVHAFPFADTVATAASFFPGLRPWHIQAVDVLAPGGLVGRRPEPGERDDRRLADDELDWIESTTADRGPSYFLVIAPGNVQVIRRDQARSEATRARLSERRARERSMTDAVERARRDLPMALVDHVPGDRPDGLVPGRVGRWSPKSQRRLIQTIGRLDLAPIVGGTYPPAMVTLTLPGDWLAVCPDAATGTAILKRFEKRYLRKWGVPLRCIWKREFQRRGAPHWHLWLAPPASHWEFARWLSSTWTDCLQIDTSTAHGRQEHRNSLMVGTGLDHRQSADARDPRSLALYFLKETLGGEGKAYQNVTPREWDGASSGRYWGTKGLAQVKSEVTLTQDQGVRVWRALRRVRAQDRVVKRVLRCRRAHDHTRRCFRRQRRAAVAPASSGWVAAKSGPDLAIVLSRLTDPPQRGRLGWVEGPSLARQALDARG